MTGQKVQGRSRESARARLVRKNLSQVKYDVMMLLMSVVRSGQAVQSMRRRRILIKLIASLCMGMSGVAKAHYRFSTRLIKQQ